MRNSELFHLCAFITSLSLSSAFHHIRIDNCACVIFSLILLYCPNDDIGFIPNARNMKSHSQRKVFSYQKLLLKSSQYENFKAYIYIYIIEVAGESYGI